MHSQVRDTGPALDILDKHWKGPKLAYAETGKLEKPDWSFKEICNPKKYAEEINTWIKKQHFLQKELRSISPSIEIFIDHIDYIVKLIGIDFVAVGSDYDGLDCLPKEIIDCRDHIKIAESLDKRGYATSDIEKVMGLNLLRVIQTIED